jgi:hypothetical protein
MSVQPCVATAERTADGDGRLPAATVLLVVRAMGTTDSHACTPCCILKCRPIVVDMRLGLVDGLTCAISQMCVCHGQYVQVTWQCLFF